MDGEGGRRYSNEIVVFGALSRLANTARMIATCFSIEVMVMDRDFD